MLHLPQRRLLVGAPTPWSPLLLGPDLIGWFDAGRWASLTLGAGGAVSGWTSLVQDWAVLQAVASAQPVYLAAQPSFGGEAVLSFDGGDQLLRDPPPVPVFRNRTGGTLAAVLEYNAPGSDAAPVFVANGISVSNTRAALGVRSNGVWALFARRLDGDTLASATGTGQGTTPVLQIGGFAWASGSATAHVNGAQVYGGGLTSAGSTSDTPDQRVAFGLSPLPWAGGRIAEVMLAGRVLTPDERQRWEGYAAHRYGLAGSLPVDHPFRAARPRATFAEREALADRLSETAFTFPAERAHAGALVPLRRSVPGWRVAA